MSELKPSRRELLYNRLRAFKRMVRSGAECGIDELTEECEAIESIYRIPDTAPADGCEGVINEIRCDCGCGTMYACRVDLNGHGIQLCCTKCGAVVRWIPDTPKEGDTA